MTQAHPFLGARRPPRVIAHRGAPSVDALENSLAAFATAHAVGADIVETDVRVTADGIAVFFHDRTLARVLNDPRPLSDVTSSELDDMMSRRGGLARVEDICDAFPTMRFNIDVKEDAAVSPVARLARRYPHRVLLTSFDDNRRRRALDLCGSARPATSPGQSIMARLVAFTAFGMKKRVASLLDEVDALQIPVSYRGVRVFSPALVEHAHDKGVEVHVWTINTATRMNALLDAGADGIVTDRAELGVRVVSGRTRESI